MIDKISHKIEELIGSEHNLNEENNGLNEERVEDWIEKCVSKHFLSNVSLFWQWIQIRLKKVKQKVIKL